MGRRLPRPTPETAQVVHQREAFLGALRGRSNVPIPVGRDANSLARSRAGGASASAVRAYQDEFVLAGGEEEVELTYLPLTYSEHVYLNGVYQREGADYDWTRESGTRTVTVKAAMDARADDILIVEYLYYAGNPVRPATAIPSEATVVDHGNVPIDNDAPVTPSLPTGTADGDLLVLALGLGSSAEPSGVSDWTLRGSAESETEHLDGSGKVYVRVYTRVYSSATYTAPSIAPVGGKIGANITAVRGADVPPVDAVTTFGTPIGDTSPYEFAGPTTTRAGIIYTAVAISSDLTVNNESISNIPTWPTDGAANTHGPSRLGLETYTGEWDSFGATGTVSMTSLSGAIAVVVLAIV